MSRNKILLIDDSLTQLEMLKLKFTQSGFDVEIANDGGEGYQKVFATAPDLILSDILMPNMNGFQLCRLLKNNPVTSKIPIILLTVLDKKIDKFWGNKSGADKFISKTSDFSEIAQEVKTLIENNKISTDYKKAILNNDVTDVTIQTQINNVLDELLMNATFLNEFRDLGEFLSQEKVLVEKTFELLGSFIDYNVAGIFFNHGENNEKKILHLDINKSSVSGFVVEKIKRDFFTQMPKVKAFTIRDFGHDIVNEKVDNQHIIINVSEFETAYILPIMSQGTLIGGICFYSQEKCNYSEFKFYNTMVNELAVLFRMRYLYSRTEYLSVTDGLTGLYNRRHFEVNIEREFLRAKRYGSILSLAMLDIDHFKKVNDTYGHQFGDYVLREISSIIFSSFRKTDMIYRYGGEEIAIILTETSMENALIPIERLREKISQHKFCYNNEEVHITISIGVSENLEYIENQKDFVECADKALYKAKQDGRNKVVAYSNEEFSKSI